MATATVMGTDTSTRTMKFTAFDRYFGLTTPVIWTNAFIIGGIQVMSLYALIAVLPKTKYITILFSWIINTIGILGVTVGIHRLWTHRSFKATTPTRFMLMLMYMFSGSYSMVSWVKDHRMHHRYADTNTDPHNINRGFFYAHMGWMMMRKHPDLLAKKNDIDISDVLADPVIQFHQKYFNHLLIVFHMIIPSAFAYYVLGENLKTCIFVVFFMRYTLSMHVIWSVNSVSHMFGYRPYNKKICSAQNKAVALITLGEGWHNFHHTFPWDYRLGEVHTEWKVAGHVIDALAYFGLAYDLKYASPELVRKVCLKNQTDDEHIKEIDETYAAKRKCF